MFLEVQVFLSENVLDNLRVADVDAHLSGQVSDYHRVLASIEATLKAFDLVEHEGIGVWGNFVRLGLDALTILSHQVKGNTNNEAVIAGIIVHFLPFKAFDFCHGTRVGKVKGYEEADKEGPSQFD